MSKALTIFKGKSASLFFYWNNSSPVRANFTVHGDQVSSCRDFLGMGIADNVGYRTVYVGMGRLVMHFNFRPKHYVPCWANPREWHENVIDLSVFRSNKCKRK